MYELRRVEEHIIDCPLCSSAIEGLENIGTKNIEVEFSNLDKKITESVVKKGNPKYIYSSVAAALLIVIVSVFYLTRIPPNEELYNEYFNTYPDITVHKRGVGEEIKLSSAMDLYNQKKYMEAIKLFDEIISESGNETAVFYRESH